MNRFPLVAALALAGTLAASDASAHAYPKTETPASGSTIQTAPGTVAIEFDDELVPAFTAMTVTNAAGQSVDRGASHVGAGDKRHLSVAVQKLPAGTYTVDWHATDTDTHKTKGRYSFTVAP
ncbi:MAG TPA: copper resistance protein CopC [Acetobacteraceae bacterium]|nr:copper resistance protein CopC [Acetobacteraceae bacterium]